MDVSTAPTLTRIEQCQANAKKRSEQKCQATLTALARNCAAPWLPPRTVWFSKKGILGPFSGSSRVGLLASPPSVLSRQTSVHRGVLLAYARRDLSGKAGYHLPLEGARSCLQDVALLATIVAWLYSYMQERTRIHGYLCHGHNTFLPRGCLSAALHSS